MRNLRQKVLYPGSFDPPTLGHLDLIERALSLFGEVVVAIGVNSSKQGLFSPEERLELLTASLSQREGLSFATFEGLVVDACREQGCTMILRGLRSVADFEFETQMSQTNRQISGGIETLFMSPSPRYAFTSSSLIKEIVRGGGDASPFLPKAVLPALREKLA